MANWQGPSHAKEQRGADLPGTRPRRAYLMQRVDGTWTFGVGDPTEEDGVIVSAPMPGAPGAAYVDDDLSLPHRQPLLIGSSTVIL